MGIYWWWSWAILWRFAQMLPWLERISCTMLILLAVGVIIFLMR